MTIMEFCGVNGGDKVALPVTNIHHAELKNSCGDNEPARVILHSRDKWSWTWEYDSYENAKREFDRLVSIMAEGDNLGDPDGIRIEDANADAAVMWEAIAGKLAEYLDRACEEKTSIEECNNCDIPCGNDPWIIQAKKELGYE